MPARTSCSSSRPAIAASWRGSARRWATGCRCWPTWWRVARRRFCRPLNWAQLGFRLVIYPGAMVRMLSRAGQDYLQALRRDGSTLNIVERMNDFDAINEVIGTDAMLALGERYKADGLTALAAGVRTRDHFAVSDGLSQRPAETPCARRCAGWVSIRPSMPSASSRRASVSAWDPGRGIPAARVCRQSANASHAKRLIIYHVLTGYFELTFRAGDEQSKGP